MGGLSISIRFARHSASVPARPQRYLDGQLTKPKTGGRAAAGLRAAGRLAGFGAQALRLTGCGGQQVAGRRGRGPRPHGRAEAAPRPRQARPGLHRRDLPRLERACAGRAFTQRRGAALIAVFRATGVRLSELAGVRYDPGDPGRSDIDLWHREITVHGKGRKTRVVKISFDAARSLDRYLRVRARHPQAYRPQLWLGAGQPGADERQRNLPGHSPARTPVRYRRVPAPVPAPLQPHLARPRRGRGRPDGTQRLDLPADAPPLRRQRPQRQGKPCRLCVAGRAS